MMRWSGNKARTGCNVSLIGEGSLFDGVLHTTSDLRIEGEFKGVLHSTGEVAIGEKGYVHAADLQARDVVIAGRVEGSVQAERIVRLTATARLTGTVKAPSLIIEHGAVFKGHSEMIEQMEDAVPDPVMV